MGMYIYIHIPEFKSVVNRLPVEAPPVTAKGQNNYIIIILYAAVYSYSTYTCSYNNIIISM